MPPNRLRKIRKNNTILYFISLLLVILFIFSLFIIKRKNSGTNLTIKERGQYDYIFVKDSNIASTEVAIDLSLPIHNSKEIAQEIQNSLQDVGHRLKKLITDFTDYSTKMSTENNKLVAGVKKEEITAKKALLYGLLNNLIVQRDSMELFNKIIELYDNSNLNKHQKEYFNMFMKEETIKIAQQGLIQNADFIKFILDTFIGQKINELYQNKKFIKITNFFYNLNILCYSPGDPKYNPVINGIQHTYYKLNDVHCLKFSWTTAVFSFLHYFYDLDSDGKILKERILSEQYIIEVAKPGELEALKYENKRMRIISEELLIYLFEDKVKYDIKQYRKFAIDFMECFHRITNKIKQKNN